MDKAKSTQVQLSKVCKVDSGAGFPLRYQGLKDRKYPFFKVGDMNTPGNELEMRIHQHSISEETRQELGARAFPPGAVVFPKIGAAIATNKKRILVKPSCVDNNVMAVVPSESISPTFLYYLLVNKDLSDFASTGNPPSMRKTTVESWEISLPPLPEQKRIATTLAKADRLRCLRRYARDLSDSYLQSVFLEMFESYLVEENHPEFGDVLGRSLQNGVFEKNDKYGSGTPVIWVDNLYHTISINTEGLRRALLDQEAIEKYKVIEGDLLFTRSSLVREGIGQINIVPKLSERTTFECHIIRARVDREVVDPYYVLGLYRSAFGKTQILKRSKTATMTTIGQDGISSLPCPIPSLSLQQQFAHIVHKFERLRAQQREAERQAEHLFQALLHRAFRKELSAPS